MGYHTSHLKYSRYCLQVQDETIFVRNKMKRLSAVVDEIRVLSLSILAIRVVDCRVDCIYSRVQVGKEKRNKNKYDANANFVRTHQVPGINDS